jgi:hypothetical protein
MPEELCISPLGVRSGWVALEGSTAIHRDPSNESRRFIPLRLADNRRPQQAQFPSPAADPTQAEAFATILPSPE